ncbi:MAG: hypothetical protein J3K34DRAFT_519417 [Monoraphidium minutum]|nr:MAG: hypothetical protein J3K34DRAFT_519417 [Monoraphidium minutum]
MQALPLWQSMRALPGPRGVAARRATHALPLSPRPPHPQRRSRRSALVWARHETRQSAFNVAARKSAARDRAPQEDGSEGPAAAPRQTIAFLYAQDLQAITRGRLSEQAALALVTSSPRLLRLPPPRLAERMAAHAAALGVAVADVAELLVRNHELADVLPLRLRQGADALAAALGVPRVLALSVIAQRPAALSTPPLRAAQAVEGIAEALRLPRRAAAALVVREAALLGVQPHALSQRVAAIQRLVRMGWSDALALCCDEPRLLLPASAALRRNFDALAGHLLEFVGDPRALEGLDALSDLSGTGGARARASGTHADAAAAGGGGGEGEGGADAEGEREGEDGGSSGDGGGEGGGGGSDLESGERRGDGGGYRVAARVLRNWARRAPLLLARSADATAARLRELPQELAAAPRCALAAALAPAAARPAALLRWAARDPRALLAPRGGGGRGAVEELSRAMGRHPAVVAALVAAHPSYLVVQHGALQGWVADVAHLLQAEGREAAWLAGEPEVFLTMAPEAVLTAVHGLSDALAAPFTAARRLALAEPRLLLVDPAGVAAQFAALRAALPGAASLAVALAERDPSALLPGGPGAARRAALPALAAALGVAPFAVAEAAAASGDVLRAPPGNAAAVLRAVVGAGLAAAPRAASFMLAQPALMYADPEDVAESAADLAAGLSRHPPWLAELANSLDASAAGLLLLQSPSRLPLLLYLIRRGEAGRADLRDAVVMGSDERYRLFGQDWVAWIQRYRRLQWRRRGGGRAAEGAAAAGGGGGEEAASWQGLGEDIGGGDADGGGADGGGDDEDGVWAESWPEAGVEAGAVPAAAEHGAERQGFIGGQLCIKDGVAVWWPGKPSGRGGQVLRFQYAAARLYRAGSLGLLDDYWRAQPWWRDDEEAAAGGGGEGSEGGGGGEGVGVGGEGSPG